MNPGGSCESQMLVICLQVKVTWNIANHSKMVAADNLALIATIIITLSGKSQFFVQDLSLITNH